ncbi:hydroxyacylglutathione hydrolase [Patescibacteria group bacterium]|nr:hydroxyacylglutathione hydrolase [Patescibacteria group bacterium]
MLDIIQIPLLTDNYSYLLRDDVTDETAVVDPAEAEPILRMLEENDWQLDYIFNTHHHWDHVEGNLELKRQTDCKIIGSEADKLRIPGLDRTVKEGDTIQLGSHKARIIETSGHTQGHIVYHFFKDNALFCGDTLFVMGCGRLFEGTAAELWHSLQKLKALPPETRVYCAHEYSETNGRFALTVEPSNLALQEKMLIIRQLRQQHLSTVPSTIAEELATNPFLRTDSLALREHLNCTDADEITVFTKLRQLKDYF